jgi:hypothetical protein
VPATDEPPAVILSSHPVSLPSWPHHANPIQKCDKKKSFVEHTRTRASLHP